MIGEGTKLASAAGPAPLGSAADAAREGAAAAAAGKDLPGSAQDIAKQKTEVAALGTKPGAKLAHAKGVEEDAAKKTADLDRAKEIERPKEKKSEEPVNPDDSADIEE